MFTTIRNAFHNPDLRKRILYTLMILVIFRFGSAILVPFVSGSGLQSLVGENSFFGLLNMFSGGAFANATIFALSISPYITAQIVIQLLTVAIPPLERMAKEGETGRKKLDRITRFTMIGMCLLQSFGYYTLLLSQGSIASAYTTGATKWFVMIVIMFTFTAGACAVTWMGDRITEKGIGNGISMILFAGILAGLPSSVEVLIEKLSEGGINYVLVPLILLIFAAMIVFIIIMTDAERRIQISYAKRVVGRKMYGGQNSYLPIKVNMSGVMPIIFASSLLSTPSLIGGFTNPTAGSFWYNVLSWLSPSHWFYGILYFILIIGFNYFYVTMQYNPIEIANNIKNNNGAIPGIRPGKPTSTYISKLIGKIAMIGALFLGVIAVFPIVFNAIFKIPVALGGTSIIIVVGVALETMKQIESQLIMRHHKGFLE